MFFSYDPYPQHITQPLSKDVVKQYFVEFFYSTSGINFIA